MPWPIAQCLGAVLARGTDAHNFPFEDYTFHAYGRSEGVCGIIISDHAYPAMVAHQLLSKVVDEFLSKNPRSAWADIPGAASNNGTPPVPFPELVDYLQKYQDPQQADSIMKIQRELDETKIVLHKTIESVLQRGEKIDDLVAKSDGLSAQSKMFYRTLLRPPGPIPLFPCSDSVLMGSVSQNKQRSRTRAACSCKQQLDWDLAPAAVDRGSIYEASGV